MFGLDIAFSYFVFRPASLRLGKTGDCGGGMALWKNRRRREDEGTSSLARIEKM